MINELKPYLKDFLPPVGSFEFRGIQSDGSTCAIEFAWTEDRITVGPPIIRASEYSRGMLAFVGFEIRRDKLHFRGMLDASSFSINYGEDQGRASDLISIEYELTLRKSAERLETVRLRVSEHIDLAVRRIKDLECTR